MGPKSRYSEKLKDPRWQKKRLSILERDGWACQKCGDTDQTLHVHHIRYGHKEPWDVPDSWLVTMCSDCHEDESVEQRAAMLALFDAFRMHFWTDQIQCFAAQFANCDLSQINKQEREQILFHCITRPDLMEAAEDDYLTTMRDMWGDDYAKENE